MEKLKSLYEHVICTMCGDSFDEEFHQHPLNEEAETGDVKLETGDVELETVCRSCRGHGLYIEKKYIDEEDA
ncbi:hypothetical protein ACJXWG_004571 [Vibrio parahaemolyticus]|nr:hypothetical protein [Vibrio parahaemolyticus]